MINNNKQYILCAAIKQDDVIILGYRHSDCLRQYFELTGKPMNYENQGFLTSHNKFVGRGEGYKIALKAGQIKKKKYGTLYSEDLYTKNNKQCKN